jgi:single-strand DNA-binding protein
MSRKNINRVTLTGNLTSDPELRALSNGHSICRLRLACNGARKTSAGEWEERPNYFDVSVWGGQAEACKRYLKKGRPVAVDGRLDWSEWEQDGKRRQAVSVVADTVQFLGAPATASATVSESAGSELVVVGVESAADQEPAAAGEGEGDDLPF